MKHANLIVFVIFLIILFPWLIVSAELSSKEVVVATYTAKSAEKCIYDTTFDDFVEGKYLKDGKPVNRFANKNKLYTEIPATNAKKYYAALKVVTSNESLQNLKITGLYKAGLRTLIFYSVDSSSGGPGFRNSGLLVMKGKSVMFTYNNAWPGQVERYLWDIFELEKGTVLLVYLYREGEESLFEYFDLTSGKIYFMGGGPFIFKENPTSF